MKILYLIGKNRNHEIHEKAVMVRLNINKGAQILTPAPLQNRPKLRFRRGGSQTLPLPRAVKGTPSPKIGLWQFLEKGPEDEDFFQSVNVLSDQYRKGTKKKRKDNGSSRQMIQSNRNLGYAANFG